MVTRLLPWWWWGIISAVFGIITIGISVGFTIYWVHAGLSNECGALDYILRHGNPRSAPTFYTAVMNWAHGDGCT